VSWKLGKSNSVKSETGLQLWRT